MRKVLKWLGIILGVLVALIIVVVIVGTVRANSMLTKEWDYAAETLVVPTDAESVARGEDLIQHWMLCADCHGADLSGGVMIDDPSFATLYAPNLTSGAGGIGAAYTDADWLRALRHGIRPNGENLIIMPAEFYTLVASDEIVQMIAYLKTLPPVDNQIPERTLAFMPKVMIGLGVIPIADLVPAYKIDHALVTDPAPPRGVTVEFGDYRATTCKACHGENLAGAPEDVENGFPATPNLTAGGELAAWTEADFLTTLQTGVTPTGHELDPLGMPWERIGAADVDDLRAIWLYLQSLPATPTNQ
jgi:cytochrome c553